MTHSRSCYSFIRSLHSAPNNAPIPKCLRNNKNASTKRLFNIELATLRDEFPISQPTTLRFRVLKFSGVIKIFSKYFIIFAKKIMLCSKAAFMN